jgi:hypothetical protein
MHRFHAKFSPAACLLAMLLVVTPNITRAAIRVEAYRGEPFGIGRITVELPGADNTAAADERFSLKEARGRVLYPVIEQRRQPVRRLLRELLDVEIAAPGRATFYFMFRGDEPLDLFVYAPEEHAITARPRDDARRFDELLNTWWRATENRYQRVFREAEYPVVVENYLTAVWARRLDREMPEPRRRLLRQWRGLEPWVAQLLGGEAYQMEVERALLMGRVASRQEATIPLARLSAPDDSRRPPPIANAHATEDELPPPSTDRPQNIELLATHVPQECFYMRFGNFPNYLWFRDFMRHWQGDLANMLVQQSVNYHGSDRFQQQIAVGESKLARVMGPTVIRDVAIIGTDIYLRTGAAMGILFHANNSALLENNLRSQRRAAMDRHEGATDETLQIAGRDVSYTSSADGRLRSFYAIDGDFHLVTNSRAIVERFFAAGSGENSLASNDEFRQARQSRPLDRDDTIFIYLSSACLENLASPRYRIELDRRLRSIGEMRSLQLARLAAAAEGHPAETIEDLVAVELLPPEFGRRPDGSRLVEAEHGWRDSLRGLPGRMVPIPDVPVERVSKEEAQRYDEFQRGLRESIGRFSPISIALERRTSPAHDGWDRIIAEVRITPYSQMPIGRWPDMLGPAALLRLAPREGDVASLEVVLDALGEPVHLFGGLRDFSTPFVVREGQVRPAAPTAEFLRAYVGGWPRPHLLDGILGRPAGPYDDQGIARSRGLFDLWLRRADDFFLFSFKRDVLMEVGPQLEIVEADSHAQVRLRVEDLSDKQFADAVSALGYMRARDTSASAARFMNSLNTLLHVPPQEAGPLAEALVGGEFACPLGGEYELVDPFSRDIDRSAPSRNAAELPLPDGEFDAATERRLWASTATPPENRFLLTEVPADYTMPLMDWFRGLEAEVARLDDELTLHLELDMVHLEVAPPEDPGVDSEGGFLRGLGNLLGSLGRTKDEEVKPAAASQRAEAAGDEQ